MVFAHEHELRNSYPVRFLELFTGGAAGEGDDRFRGEHPSVQEWNDAGYKDAAFFYRGGSLVFVYPVAIVMGKVGEVKFFAGRDLFNGKELIAGVHAPGFVEPFFVRGERRILNEVGQGAVSN